MAGTKKRIDMSHPAAGPVTVRRRDGSVETQAPRPASPGQGVGQTWGYPAEGSDHEFEVEELLRRRP